MEPDRSAKGQRAEAWGHVEAASAAAGAAVEARAAKAEAKGAVVVLVAAGSKVG